ncbi:MAG: hypothetical protein GX593_00760 [Actinomycetales bacterium]|nr:hypothetical protein [Actinomycetales bacterium]
MRELSELLADSVDARARSVAGLTPDQGDFDTIVRTVRRKRVVRRSLQTLAVVPVVGGLAAGVYLGAGVIGDARIDPAATPTEVVTTPTPTADAFDKGALVNEDGLPPFYEAPADLLEHVGEGWVALAYRPQPASNTTGQEEALSNGIFLASPTGDLFRAVELPLERDVQVVAWDTASSQVRVSWPEPEGSARLLTLGWVDLATGEISQDLEQFEEWARFVGHSHAGAELWVEDGEAGSLLWSLAPDGSRRHVVESHVPFIGAIDPSGRAVLTEGAVPESGFAVIDIDSRDVREVPFGTAGQKCTVVGWLDATSVATLCHDPVSEEAELAMDRVNFVAQNAVLYRVETLADGGVTPIYTFAEGDPVPESWTGHWVNGSLAFVVSSGFPGGCSLGVGVWDGTAPRAVLDGGAYSANIFWLQPGAAGQLLVLGSQSCESSGVQSEVWSVDVATGASATLTPWLEADPDAGRDYWFRTVTSMAG